MLTTKLFCVKIGKIEKPPLGFGVTQAGEFPFPSSSHAGAEGHLWEDVLC
jgi:hypothetical protein